MRTSVRAGGIATAEGIGGPAVILIADGVIEAVIEGDEVRAGDAIVDASDAVVAAGMVDVHTHGAAGAQFIDGSAEDIARAAELYALHGVTAFLATVGGSDRSIRAGISAAVAYIEGNRPEHAARCLGIHLEGPFISPDWPGAFVPSTIVAPDASLLSRYADLARGHLRRITLAPEVPGMRAVIEEAVRRGIGCSAGHSGATDADMDAAVATGVTSVTHLFNAMRPLHHRHPGIVGATLNDDRLVAEVIADGVHVAPAVLKLVWKAKGWAGIALVSDSIGAAGLPDGRYELEEQSILVEDGEARLHDGSLAGSTLTLDEAVRRFAGASGIPWHEAHASASRVPAQLAGAADRLGSIAPGMLADLVAFGHAGRVLWTMIGGAVVHRA